jgi:hypothetical protein
MIQWTDSSWVDDYVDHLIDGYWGDRSRIQKQQPTKSKTMTQKLQKGDLVRKKYGTKVIEVTEEYGSTVYGRYVHSGASTGRLDARHVVLLDEHKTETEQGYGKMKGKLFQTKDGAFGVGLAVNSKGEYVLEMKGTGDLVAYHKKDVELVMPFTFSAQFNGTGTEYSYLGKEGSVKIGDLLLKTDSKGITVARVTAVDTKSEKATKYFDGVKIVTEAIEN